MKEPGAHGKADSGITGEPALAVQFPTFRQAFLFWLKLGFISFGGPAGQLGIMHEFLVVKNKWISESRFLHALNYCMLLPGPEAQQMATYMGWLLHGTRGGITAGVLFILPGLLILAALSITYVTFGSIFWVAGLFYGLKPAVIAIIVIALIKIGKKSLRTVFHVAIAVISFACIYFFKISFPLIVITAILLGMAIQKFLPSFLTHSKAANDTSIDEEGYVIHHHSPPRKDKLTMRNTLFKVVIAAVLWMLPLLIFVLSATDFLFWKSVSLFFTKAAFVTFGGAYAVLPYVAQVSVEEFHWLTNFQMIDGLALGETTPGPLILILVFVGFMAGYNHFQGSILAGTIGLATTAYYTFLPSFLFILIGAPWVERTKDNERLKEILSIVTAAVVGVILNLTIYFSQSVLFHNMQPDYFSILWCLTSFIALYRFNLDMIVWIGISALAGLLYTLSVGVV